MGWIPNLNTEQNVCPLGEKVFLVYHGVEFTMHIILERTFHITWYSFRMTVNIPASNGRVKLAFWDTGWIGTYEFMFSVNFVRILDKLGRFCIPNSPHFLRSLLCHSRFVDGLLFAANAAPKHALRESAC